MVEIARLFIDEETQEIKLVGQNKIVLAKPAGRYHYHILEQTQNDIKRVDISPNSEVVQRMFMLVCPD